MARYFINFDGLPEDEEGEEFPTADDARNAAIMRLGKHLQAKPDFAYQRHWRVDIRDHAHRLVAHVIVATVAAAPPLNWDSLERRPDNYRQGSRPE